MLQFLKKDSLLQKSFFFEVRWTITGVAQIQRKGLCYTMVIFYEVVTGDTQFYSPELFVRDPLKMKLYKVALRCKYYYGEKLFRGKAHRTSNYCVQKWAPDKNDWETGECDSLKFYSAINVSEIDFSDHTSHVLIHICKFTKDTNPVADYPVTTLYQDVLDYDPASFVIECQEKELTVSIFRVLVWLFSEKKRAGHPVILPTRAWKNSVRDS